MADQDKGKTQRLDQALVSRGFMESRAQAQAAIKAGNVRIDGQLAKKASLTVSEQQIIEAEKAHPYVSRGGLKLEHGLSAFGVSAAGKVCLDVGASTGGFTDVLLRNDAQFVYAVDVGRDQLHQLIRNDARVECLENQDARALTSDIIQRSVELMVCDASFIGLEKLLGPALKLMTDRAEAVVLFKPQFQVGPENVGRAGLVKDQEAIQSARAHFDRWLLSVGWMVFQSTQSPIRGGDGNTEFLLHLKRA